MQKIYTIDETDFPLSMLDHRIGEAIQDTHAQLMILDPMQAYLGEKVDMNRANEVRTVMKGLTQGGEPNRLRHRSGGALEQISNRQQCPTRPGLHGLSSGRPERSAGGPTQE